MRQLALLVCVWGSLLASQHATPADDAAKQYQEGRKAERAGQMVRAYLLYSRAAALEPTNQFYWLKSQAVQSRAALEAPPKLPETAAKIDRGTPADTAAAFDPLTEKDRASERKAQPPPELKPATGRKDFDLRADSRSLWEQVARAFGLEVVFDGDYQAGTPIRFQITQSDYRDALHALEAATGSFIVPVSPRLLLVVKDSEQKRREVEPTMLVSIPVPQATTTQELVEIAQAVRQLFNLEHVAWDSGQNMVLLRDRNSRVVPARQIFEQLLHHRPQVDIEVQLLEVDHSDSLAYGLELPATFPLTYLGGFWNNPAAAASAISKLATFGGGQSLFGIAIADATLVANMQRTSGRTLLRTEIRALEGLPASLHIGDKYPILTSGYFGQIPSTGGQVYSPPPSFTFEDLGVSIKVTPHIHDMDEVTLDLETEFKVLGNGSLNGIPVISNRKVTSNVRLREGEWGIVAGLMTSNEARTIHGLAGISAVPVLGRLLQQNNKDQSTTEVLLIVKPTLLNVPPNQFVAPAIWTGPDTRPLTPL
jgi:type II secretory pathway component GspD/PulD (secretin)